MSEKLMVSVIMPVYNGEEFLCESIDSILSQTFRDFEFIIIDDGSTDNSLKICKIYQKKDNRVKILTHEGNRNLGVSSSRQLGVRSSKGRYISFCDADDLWKPEKIYKQVEIFTKYEDVILGHTAIEAFGSNDQFCRRFEKSNNLSQNELKYKLKRTAHFLRYNRICNSSVMVRADFIKRINFSFEQAFQYEDWLLWVLLSQYGDFYFLSEKLTKYRDHGDSSTTKIREKKILVLYSKLEFYLTLLKKYSNYRLVIKYKILYKIIQTIYHIFKKY